MFWSEIRSGFGEPGGTPPPRIPRSTPRAFSLDISAVILRVCLHDGHVANEALDFTRICRVTVFNLYPLLLSNLRESEDTSSSVVSQIT